ncbi:MAG: DUF4301 family protein [Flavobacteriaceae bacterium]|jgi:nicotinamide riboside kinase|nr:DUF4301 family protein [Flavobacteriaceae bacterium]
MEEAVRQKETSIIKIVLYGPESTGKTTLTKELATHFETIWIPEFSRQYLQKKFDKTGIICEESDLLPIVVGQTELENEAILNANKILFCDTNAVSTKVYSDYYYGQSSPLLEKIVSKHRHDLYLLTDIDVPWVSDDLRDRPNNREELLEFFENELIHLEKPYIKISGNRTTRFQKATKIIADFLESLSLGLTPHDFVQLNQYGISLESLKNQIHYIKKGIPFMQLDRIATVNDGIQHIEVEEAVFYANLFDEKRNKLKLKKMVPASGAASRMFKFLNEFLQEYKPEEESVNAYINRKKSKNLSLFLVGLEKFPFYNNLVKKAREIFPEFDISTHDIKNLILIKTLLKQELLDFANKPKGILPFHQYSSHIATPVEEQLQEAAHYACSNQKALVHFTISENHRDAFEKLVSNIKPKIEQQHEVDISVSFSYQDKSTDSLAFDLDFKPFRDLNKLLFRPGGHGALIENLNNLDADLIFIKNIDNVSQNNSKTISLYKKALAGILLDTQEKVFHYLHLLDSGNLQKEQLDEVIDFIKNRLGLDISEDFPKFTKESKIDYLHNYLNRPIRVCGMVKNEGEPGGGPFWVKNEKGYVFLQIVESSQIDLNDPTQKKILQSATHFNPVDLVCGVKNYKGIKHDLKKFVDPNTGFVVQKNKEGRELLAYELPGLWNGAMSKWLTVFVEVPIVTFSPVKTVNDLLKPAHQPRHES